MRLLLILLFIVSCAEHSPEMAKAIKSPVKLDTRLIQQLELKNHYSTTDTFTLFFFPQKGKMNWDSTVFNKEDSEEKKLSDIIAEVIRRSDLIDQADLKSFKLLLRNEDIQKELVSNNCSDSDDDFGDDFEFKDSTNICESLNQEVLENVIEMGRLSSSEKGEHLRGIQEAIDDVSFKKLDDTTFVKEGRVVNWIPYGDQNSYVFNLFLQYKEFVPQIVLPTLGEPANKYTTSDGDIFDVKYENSKYAPNTMMLFFRVKEKDRYGKHNGYEWHCELEKSNFAGKIRFSGDVFRKDYHGKTVQQGIMKFELAKNEFGDDF